MVISGGEALHVGVLGGGDCEVVVMGGGEVCIELLEQGAECRIAGIVIAGKQNRHEVQSTVRHLAPNCQSSQLFRAVVSEQAQVHFHGMIYVAQGADGTVAVQNSDNIILSDSAKVTTLPQMEIYAEDVKCNHGATVGQRDEQALYYMRQRGIPQSEAQRLLLESFCYGIVGADDPEVVSYIEKMTKEL